MTASPVPSGAVGRVAAHRRIHANGRVAARRRRIHANGCVGAALLGLVLGATAGWRRWVPGRTLPMRSPPPDA